MRERRFIKIFKMSLLAVAAVILVLAALYFTGQGKGDKSSFDGALGEKYAGGSSGEILKGEKIAPNLKLPADSLPEDKDSIVLNVILRSPDDVGELDILLQDIGGKVVAGETGDSIFIRVEVPPSRIDDLVGARFVQFVEKYEATRLLNDRAAGITGAAALRAGGYATSSGLSGKGQIVAVADSGLDTGFINNLQRDFNNSKVLYLKSLYKDGTAKDLSGHGTHIAGTIAGNGSASGGKYTGLAPGVGLYIQSILNARGRAEAPADLGKLFLPAYNAGARIHVNSWGGESNNYLSSTMQVDAFVRAHPDFLILFGAGNGGPERGTLSPEANSKNALVVGASESPRPGLGRDSDNAEEIAGLSSRGPAADGRIKPDLVAPGTAIISTLSSLAQDKNAIDRYYAVKSGTSMATAVAAGSAALLREYFVSQEKVGEPSASLVKAALVNGARRSGEDFNTFGFGVLDVQNTVLSLKERSMSSVDNHSGLVTGGSSTYRIEVSNELTPVKATLAWTDPAGSPGAGPALVNDLDLMVIGPRGNVYYGNDFKNQGKRDTKNNIEQIYIENPEIGTYTIKVMGKKVVKNALADVDSAVPAQDFALVYGSPLAHSVAIRADSLGKSFLLDSGRLLVRDRDLPMIVLANGKLSQSVPLPGADLYMAGDPKSPDKIYASYNTDIIKPARGVPLESGSYLDGPVREGTGGYGLARGSPGPLLLVNGKETTDPGEIIPGSECVVTVNPSTGRIWQASASYILAEGYIEEIYGKTVGLRGISEKYILDPGALVYQDLKWQETLSYWSPFSYGRTGSLAELKRGDMVRLVFSRENKRVNYVEYKQVMLAGVLSEDGQAFNKLTLESGRSLAINPGARIIRDGREVKLDQLRKGDIIEATLLPDSGQLWQVSAFSKIIFGRVVFDNNGAGSLLLLTEAGQLTSYDMGSAMPDVYWQGRPMGFAALQEGDYVRLALDSNDMVWRIDMAATAGEAATETTIEHYDPQKNMLTASSGQSYLVTPRTLITKDNMRVQAEDLKPGEKVLLTAVLTAVGGEKILGMAQAVSSPGATGPKLDISAPLYVDQPEVMLAIKTSPGTRLLVYINEKLQEAVKAGRGGSQGIKLALSDKGTSRITVVAVDPSDGGVSTAGVGVFWAGFDPGMADLDGHWAEKEVNEFITKGVVKGYPDGLFRPDQAVSRLEFVRLLLGTLGQPVEAGYSLLFEDSSSIARADRPYVNEALRKGLVTGYAEDNTFRPDKSITRSEMAVLIDRALNKIKPGEKFDQVQGKEQKFIGIPDWARASVYKLKAAGIMVGRGAADFSSEDSATRAEAVAALSRFYKIMLQ